MRHEILTALLSAANWVNVELRTTVELTTFDFVTITVATAIDIVADEAA